MEHRGRDDHAGGYIEAHVAPTSRGAYEGIFGRGMVVVLDDSNDEGSLVTDCVRGAGVGAVTLVTSVDELSYLIGSDAEPFPNCLVIESAFETTNGLDVIALVRNHKASRVRSLPLIVVTRDNSFERYVRWRDIGIAGFFLKPVGVDTMRRCLLNVFSEQAKYNRHETTANKWLAWLAAFWSVFTGPVASERATQRPLPTKIDILS